MNLDVLLIPFRPSGSGMHVYAGYLAKSLRLAGINVKVVGYGLPVSDLIDLGVEYYSLGPDPTKLDWLGGPLTTYKYIKKQLVKFINNTKVKTDIIHFIYPEATFKINNIPIFATAWGYSTPSEILKDSTRKFSGFWTLLGQLAELEFYFMDLLAYKRCDGVICTTRAAEQFWSQKIKGEFKYIPPPVETFHYKAKFNKNKSKPLFLVGERDLERPRNNLKTVLKSLQLLLQRKCTDFEIYLIGKHSEALKRHIGSLRIKGLNIYLFDYLSRPNLLSLLDKVDVCIVPRYIKDQGGYLPLEAMARGATIIASDMPAFRDFITNGVTGLLVDPWNYIDMANSIQLLIENRDYLKKLQTNSLKYINEFHSLDTVGKLYLLFYSNFIF